MEDREILYLAICNQIQLYSETLEQPLDEANRGMAEYILMRSLEIEEQFRLELGVESPISKPNW